MTIEPDSLDLSSFPFWPSPLIRAALDDLEKMEADPRYTVDMKIYHLAGYRSTCVVCLAGAVMAGHLVAPPDKDIVPTDYVDAGYPEVAGALYALDSFRQGLVSIALGEMEIAAPPGFPHRLGRVAITPYEDDPAAFKRDLRHLADELEKLGL